MSRSHKAPYQITEFLAIGPCAGAGGPSADRLAGMGFKHVIDLNADHSERSLSRRAGVSYSPVRIVDEESVRAWVAKLRDGVEIIESASLKREKVYVHCTYGGGRSPTMAMAYLIRSGWPIQRAVKHVKSRGKGVWGKEQPVSKYENILKAYARASGGARARLPNG